MISTLRASLRGIEPLNSSRKPAKGRARCNKLFCKPGWVLFRVAKFAALLACRQVESSAFAQREKAFSDEQQHKNRNGDEGCRKIFHVKNDIYTSAPPQEEPWPAVQPKQWLSIATRRPWSRSESRSHRKSGSSFFHCMPSCWLKSQS
jgi:hypothetical protein